MADPVTLMLIAGATQAVGAIAQGNAQAAQFDSQAAAANYNADMQRRQAEAVAQQGGAREDLQRRQARQVLGKQIAAGAESGVNIGTGSAADLFRSSLYDAETDALNIRYDSEMNRVGLLNQSAMSTWEGKVAKKNSKTAVKAGYLNAAAALAAGGYAGAKGMKGMGSAGPGLSQNGGINRVGGMGI